MGRPQEQTAKYFSHYVESNETIFILEQNWGNDGYAFWFKLLELLCKKDGHFYDYSKDASKIYLAAYTRIKEETVEDIISALVEFDEIDRELWENHKIIWCQSLVDSLKPLYSKRTASLPQKPDASEFSERKQPDSTIAEPEIEENETEKNEEKVLKKADKKKKSKPEKIKFAEFVHMTQEEYDKLVDGYGKEKTEKMITVLDNYKGSKGKTYKNDYRAILSWVVDKVNGECNPNGGNNYAGSNDIGYSSADYKNFKPSDGFSG